jgi:hypothetical protein
MGSIGRRRSIVLSIVLCVGACVSSSTDLDASIDGSFDASSDATVDASRDASHDASHDAPARDVGAPDGGDFVCPHDGVRTPGRHRLFVQGHEAPPRADGTWPLLHEVHEHEDDAELCDDARFVDDTSGDGRWQPGEAPRSLGPSELVHGEHFLVGRGSFVEITTTLCTDITGNVVFYIPNFDEEGSETLLQILVRRGRDEQLVAEVTDDEPGFSGYNPFVREVAGTDPDARAGDELVLRAINLSGAAYSVMVWRPPSEYESWILVEVP